MPKNPPSVPRSRPAILGTSVAALMVLCLMPHAARGQTWTGTTSGDWNTAGNWNPTGIPAGTSDVTFALSSTTAVSISAPTSVDSVTFSAAATSPYNFTVNPAATWNFLGAGVTNNSGVAQNFVTAVNGTGGFGTIEFANTATAGSLTLFTNDGATINGSAGGVLDFIGNSTAGNAAITNQGGTVSGANGGVTNFNASASAGSATITTNGGTGGAGGGATYFIADADGGTARAITNGNGVFDISQLTDGGMNIGSIEGSGLYNLGGNTLTVGDNNLSATVSGVIADGGIKGGTGGSLAKTGSGTLTLTANNTYTGATTVTGSGSTLQIGTAAAAGSIGASSAVNVNNLGTLVLTNVNGGTFANNVTDLAASGPSPDGAVVVNSAGTTTLSGVLSDGAVGHLSFTQNGTGITILTRANTYTGLTNVDGGTLVVNGSIASGSTVDVAVATLSGTGTIAGSVSLIGGNLAPGGQATPGTLTVGSLSMSEASNTFRLGQPAGTNDLVDVTGNLTLDGSLAIQPLGGFGVGTYTLFNYGGTLVNDGFTLATKVPGLGLAVSTAVHGEVQLVVSYPGGAQYWDGSGAENDGIISGGNGNWGTSGADWTNSTGTANSSWQGGTAIFGLHGGTVTLISAVSAQSIYFNTAFASGGYTITGLQTLVLAGTAPAIIVSTAGTSATIGVPIAGNHGLIASGAGTLLLTNKANSYSGGTTISNGTLQVGNLGAPGSLGSGTVSVSNGGILALWNVTGGTLTNNITNGVGGLGTIQTTFLTPFTFAGTLTDGTAGQLGLQITLGNASQGILITNAHNTYSGPTTISQNTLQIGNGNGAGSIGANSPVEVQFGGTLVLSNVAGDALPNNISNSDGGTGTLNVDTGNNITLSGAISDTNGTGLGKITLIQNGPAITTLTGTDSYSGATTINAGNLQVGDGTGGNLTGNSTVTVSGTSILILDPPTGSTMVATIVLNGTGTTLKAIQSGNIAIDGVISGTGVFNQIGTGITEFESAETYTGATNVVAGTLQIDDSLAAASTVNVGTNGTLSGAGTIAGNVTLAGNGTINLSSGTIGGMLTIAGGNWIGTGTVGGLITSSSGTFTLGSGASLVATAGLDVTGGTLAGSGGMLTGNLNYSSTATSTFGGVIAGTSTLTVNNAAGTLKLTAANTYTGLTQVDAGTLEVDDSLASGTVVNIAGAGVLSGAGTINGDVNVTGGGAINLGPTGEIDGAVVATGAHWNGQGTTGSVTSNSSTFTLSGSLTTGTLTITGGTLAGSGTLNGSLAYNSTSSSTFGGAITTAISMAGAGATLTLTGANTVTGTVAISAGTLQIGNGTSGNLSIALVAVTNSGILATDLATNSVFTPAVSLGNTTSALNAIQSGTNTLSGVISGAGGFNQNGTGTTTLNNTESYTGATTVNAGTLLIGDGTNGNLIGTSGVTVNGTGSLAVNLADGSTFAQTVNLNATGATFKAIQTGSLIVSSAINGTGVFDQNGTGTTELQAAETYTGATNVNAGTLQVDTSLAAGSTVNVGSAGTLTGAGTINGNATLTGIGTIKLASGTIAGTLAITGGNWTGTGTVGGLVTSSSSTFNLTGSLTAPLGLVVTGGSLAGAGTLTGSLNYASSSNSTFGGVITDGATTATLTVNKASSTLTVTGASTYTGLTTVSAGKLQLGDGNTTGTALGGNAVTVSGTGILAIDLSDSSNFTNGVNLNAVGATLKMIQVNTNDVTGVISGSGVFDQSGTGVTVLSNAEIYTGATNVTAGILEVDNSLAAGSTVNVTGGATLRGTGTINGKATLGGGGIIDFSSSGATGNIVGTLGVTGGSWIGVGTVGGAVTASSGNFNLNGTLTAPSGLAVTGGTLAGNGTLAGSLNYASSSSGTFGGTITGPASAVTMNKAGATLTLTGANTYGSVTTISAGTLQFGDGITTGTTLGSNNVTVSGSGALAMDVAGTSAFTNNIILNTTTATLKTLQTGATTLSGVISGTGSVNQNGPGTTILTAANTYTGVTSITAGTLQVDNSLAATSTVNVAAGGTLAGVGTVPGTVNVLAGGSLDAGDSTGPGTLTVGKLVLSAGSNSNFRLAAPGTVGGGVNDLIDVTGNLNLAGNLNITALTGFGTTIGSYTLFTYGGTLTNTGFSAINGTGGFAATVSTGTAHQVNLVVSGTATTQYWDGTGAPNNNIISGGSGTWNSTTSNWTTSTGATNSAWQGGSAVFDAPGGTVNLTSPISVQGLLFGSTGYTLSGSSPLNLVGTAGAAPTISVSNAGTTATISAPVTGNAGLTASGAGTLILTNAANSYTGGTNITIGTLQVGTTSAAGSIGGGTISVAGGGTLSLVNLHGNTLANKVTGGVAGTGALNINSTASNTLSGALTDGTPGQLALTQSGAGTTILTNTGNAFSGATTISKGTLQIGTTTAAGSLPSTSAVSIGSGATLAVVNVAGNTLASNISNGLSGIGLVNVNSTGSNTLSGTLSNGGTGTLALTQSGTGTTTITGTDSYTGVTTVSAGTLQIGNGTAGNLTGTSAVTVSGTGTLAMDLAAGATFSQNVSLSAAGASLKGVEAGATSNTLTGVISGTGSVNQNGAGKTILTNTETYTGATNVTTGTLEVDGILAAGSTVNVTTGGKLTGLGTIKGKATLTGSGAIDFGTGGIIDGTLTVAGGTWSGVGTVDGIVTSSSSVFTLGDNLTVSAAGGLAITGGTIAGNGTLTGSLNDTSSTSMIFGGIVAGPASTVTMNKASSTLTLTGANTYDGATTITAGTLQVGNGTTTGATLSTSTVTVAASGTLTTDLANGEIFGNGVTDNGHVIATGTTNNYTVSSLISGTGNFTKAGANFVTVTNANTYKGGTVIGGGTLLVNNASGSGTGSGAVTVNNVGTLGGNGTISGATTLNSGGTLFPSVASPGTAGTTLHGSSLIWNGGGTLTLQLADGADDALALSGALTKGTAGTYTLDLINAGLISTNTYNLTLVTFASSTFTAANFTVELPLNYTGTLIKTSTSLEIENLTDPPPASGELPRGEDLAVTGSVDSEQSTPSDLTVTPTPEPGSALLLTFGGAALLGWRRRRPV